MNIGFKVALASIPWFLFWFLLCSVFRDEREKYDTLFYVGSLGTVLGIASFFSGLFVGILIL